MGPKKRLRRKYRQADCKDDDDPPPLLVVDKAVSITLIASEIFRHLSLQDLLSCSLVNKIWRSSACFTLREDRQTCAYIGGKRGVEACKDLNDLTFNVLPKIHSIPFSGLSYTVLGQNANNNIPDNHGCTSIKARKTPAPIFFKDLLASVKVKCLRISWQVQPKVTCPVFKLFAHIVKDPDLSKHLIGFVVHRLPSSPIPENFAEYFDPAVGCLSFSNLKYLDLQLPREQWLWSETKSPILLFKQLLLAAPKLQALKGYIPLDFLPTLFELKKEGTLQDLSFDVKLDSEFELLRNPAVTLHTADELFDFALKLVEKNTQIHRLSFQLSFIMERYRRAVPQRPQELVSGLRSKGDKACAQILQRCRRSIRKLLLNYEDIQIRLFNATRLQNQLYPGDGMQFSRLTELVITSSSLTETVGSLKQISSYGFQQFPSLKCIDIQRAQRPSPFVLYDFNLFSGFGEGSSTVTKFRMTADDQDFAACEHEVEFKTVIKFLAKKFPNVKNFTVNFRYDEHMREGCGVLWKAWPELEVLVLDSIGKKEAIKNWDPLFTGLMPADCNMRQIRDVDRFKQLRVSPSLQRLTKLKRLQINLQDHDCTLTNERALHKVFLSEVTGRFVFQQLPKLTVHIYRGCGDAVDYEVPKCDLTLKHLLPFVKFDNFVPGSY